MAHEDIQSRLGRWAEWLLRSSGGALGFPRECPYTRMQARSESGFCSEEIDTESAETEKAVQTLPAEYKLVVQVYYLYGGTREQQARALQCPLSTMKRRIGMAHEMVSSALDDIRESRRKKNIQITS